MARMPIHALRRAALHVSDTAAAPAHFAAEELQRYLHAMTDARLPIVPASADAGTIVVAAHGAPARTSVPPQPGSFVIVPEAERITLAAASPRALLERLGCRWSLHAPDEETVPRLSVATLEVDPIQCTPPFALRGYCADIMAWHYTQPEYFHDRLPDDRAFIDWMGKSGANRFFYIRHPFDSQLVIPELATDFARRGIDVEYGGHVLPLLLPRELFQTHPEYFPEAPTGERTVHGNLCTSNAGALATAQANAVQYVRDFPEMAALHIWGADLWRGGWCHCRACATSSAQDQSLRVCNAVARGLAEAGVSRPVCYLAYHDTIDADLTLRPDPNVVAEFAPRERCYGHALDDPSCATNRRYAAALECYVELFDGRVRLFEYYGDAILFFGCAVPLPQVIAADLAYCRRLGIAEILMLQFGAFSLWAYPLNFLAFAAGTAGDPPAPPCEAYCARFGTPAVTRALFVELESIMGTIVRYGDIRRPPRDAEARHGALERISAALPRLAALAARCAGADNAALAAQGALIDYTRTVLDGVRCDLEPAADGEARYLAALEIIDRVDRRFKGLWGTIDLAIIHSLFRAAPHAE